MLGTTVVEMNNLRNQQNGKRNSTQRHSISRNIHDSEAASVDAQFCHLFDDQNSISVESLDLISDRPDESPKSQMVYSRWERLVAKY